MPWFKLWVEEKRGWLGGWVVGGGRAERVRQWTSGESLDYVGRTDLLGKFFFELNP